tara:strand:+ start:44662 stop:45687 length:1026 start_codon:yes stop_codon:yes gene_type:complete
MAFLDNSGDIILDAVLTDEGRRRLAAGDGSFKIAKFALGDDEIDYSLYENTNHPDGRHPSGSAYYDLAILQSPVLEAFTNNAGSCRSKLINYTRNDFLYLPVIELNFLKKPSTTLPTVNWSGFTVPSNGYLLTADVTTSQAFAADKVDKGLIKADTANAFTQAPIIFDQGLDSVDLSAAMMDTGDPRRETQYMVEVDNRLLEIMPADNHNEIATPSFIDDDQVATYLFMMNTNPQYFAPAGAMNNYNLQNAGGVTSAEASPLGSSTLGTGRFGTRFGFKPRVSLDVQTSVNLFNTLGGTVAQTYDTATITEFYFIDTVIRVTGYTTGYRVDIPLRILKKKA